MAALVDCRAVGLPGRARAGDEPRAARRGRRGGLAGAVAARARRAARRWRRSGWTPTRRPGCSWSGPGGRAPTSSSTTTPPPMSWPSAPASTASPWRSSWPPPGSAPCPLDRAGAAASTTPSGCSPAAPAPRCPASRPCWLDRVERRPPRRHRTGGAAPPGRVPGPLPARGRRGGRRRRHDRHRLRRARRDRPAGRQEPGPARRHHRPLPAAGDDPPVRPRPPARRR